MWLAGVRKSRSSALGQRVPADESLFHLAAFAFAFRSELLPLVPVQVFGIGLIAANFGDGFLFRVSWGIWPEGLPPGLQRGVADLAAPKPVPRLWREKNKTAATIVFVIVMASSEWLVGPESQYIDERSDQKHAAKI